MRLTKTPRTWNWIDDGVLPYALAAMRAVWLWLMLQLSAHLLDMPRRELVPLPLVFLLLALGTLCTQLAIFRLQDARGMWLVVFGGVMAVTLTVYIAFGTTPFQGLGALVITILVGAWSWRWGILAGREPLTYDTYARNFLYGVIAISLVVLGGLTTQALSLGELVFPILLFFALGLGALALASLRDAQRYEHTETGESFALNRYWMGTVAIVVAGVLLIGLSLGSLFAPEWAQTALDAVLPLWRLVTGVLLIVVYVVALVFFTILELLGRIIPFTPNRTEALAIQQSLALDGLFKNERNPPAAIPPEIYFAAHSAAAVLILVFLTALFALAFRRFREFQESDVEETRESVFSMDLLKEQMARLFRREGKGRTLVQEPFAPVSGDEPRAQVRRIYQQLLSWAAERGVSRTAGQTPREFQQALETLLQLEPEALAVMTSIYLNARYGSAPITPEDADRVTRAWTHLTTEKN